MTTVTNRRVSNVEGEVTVIRHIKIKKNRKGSSNGREFGLIISTIEMICKNRTKFSESERNGSRIKRFRKLERSDVDKALFKCFNPLYTERRLLYLKTQFVSRSKHFSSWL